ncbi:PadR family transcriptional regulator [Desulfosporosinus sp. BICA1-9]|uniref:PadR family transcriptional regulator n=1 Tax=Desulfosporosinus sp. BICA1-9 TaxID=1531958 RepID=UPI0005F18263|nr:PadR family transcriptional regulator [Desulfosporosinus sp. BICA1-9]KJS49873.1 MAG: hypothetical protein VR66_06105 [Peptococcaceae bacterium BRH_c23]KJS89492.1 MAG: hypothetical protein JL57_07020 [Desulfosporosinus sp. BICA1-9]HBW35915.1 PadR family transcriptional regulator [Desulfosporosinus sp.]
MTNKNVLSCPYPTYFLSLHQIQTYGIIQDISEMTGGRVVLGPGTLYGAINSMLTKGWISLYSEDKESRKKKEYLLTEIGREIFVKEVKRLNELVENRKKMDEETEMKKVGFISIQTGIYNPNPG